MQIETRHFAGFEFWSVGSLEIQRNADGSLAEYSHTLPEGVRSNRYSAGPFCRFGLPGAPNAAGVYAITIGYELQYIGEAVDLAQRFGPSGYGKIHPRNCHHDGQSTNCKLNFRVLEAAKRGSAARVWFHPADDRLVTESRLIGELLPPWNGRGVSTRHPSEQRDRPRVARGSASARRPGAAEQFRNALSALLTDAERSGAPSVQVQAGQLHRLVGGYPGPHHRMPVCCSAMRSLMVPGDRFIQQPPKGNGASLTIEYRLPRLPAQ